MSSSKLVSGLYDDLATNMLQFFENWDTYIPQNAEKGGVREQRVRDFLKQFLPKKYGVGRGIIVDRHGTPSLQEDIVIYDQQNCPILELDPYYQVFPCEAVFATVEVKSTLDSEEIKKCINHTAQLRKLDRRLTDGSDELGPIESFVFAYQVKKDIKDPPNWVRNWFEKIAQSEEKSLPGVVVCLKERLVLFTDFHVDASTYTMYGLEFGIMLLFLEWCLNKISRVKTAPPRLFLDYTFVRDNPLIVYRRDLD